MIAGREGGARSGIERAVGRIEGRLGEMKESLDALRDDVRSNRGLAAAEHAALTERVGRVEIALGIKDSAARAQALTEATERAETHSWRQVLAMIATAVIGAGAALASDWGFHPR